MTEILQYVHKDTLFHRLHPGTKILFVLVVSIFAIFSAEILALVGIFLAILLLAWISRLQKELFQQMTLIIVMSAILILITVFTMPAGPVLGYLIPPGVPLIGGSFPVTLGGLEYGVILTLRFAILITAVQLFVISTQPRDLVHAMERARVPPDYTLMFIIALRFIPTLQIEGKRIHEAQLARGYNPGQGFLGGIRSVAPGTDPPRLECTRPVECNGSDHRSSRLPFPDPPPAPGNDDGQSGPCSNRPAFRVLGSVRHGPGPDVLRKYAGMKNTRSF